MVCGFSPKKCAKSVKSVKRVVQADAALRGFAAGFAGWWGLQELSPLFSQDYQISSFARPRP
jgi:hypothetical protein